MAKYGRRNKQKQSYHRADEIRINVGTRRVHKENKMKPAQLMAHVKTNPNRHGTTGTSYRFANHKSHMINGPFTHLNTRKTVSKNIIR